MSPTATAVAPAPAVVATAPSFLDALAALHRDLDSLAGFDAGGLCGAEQAAALRELERAGARVKAVALGVVAAAERAQTARRSGAADTGSWAAALSRLDPAESHREVRLAKGLEQRAQARAALAAGDLSARHAAVIIDADRELPAGLSPGQRGLVEASLVEKAKTMPPGLLRRAARRAIEAVEPDTRAVDAQENRLVAEEEAAARAKTRLSLRDNHDGTVTGHFTVPTLHGHLLRKILQSMTAPRRARLGAGLAQSGGRVEPEQARGLAFCELLEHLPADRLHSRSAATVVVTMELDALRGETEKVGRLDTGAEISAGEARRIACGAGLIPAVLGGRSVPLDLGRSTRLFSEAQRAALGLARETCAAEGCERPYAWCELHHREPWAHGGKTDLKNAIPLCGFHHQRIHDPAFTHQRQPNGNVQFHQRT